MCAWDNRMNVYEYWNGMIYPTLARIIVNISALPNLHMNFPTSRFHGQFWNRAPVHLLIPALRWSANHIAEALCRKPCIYMSNIRISDSNVGAELTINYLTADLLTQQSLQLRFCRWKSLFDEKGQKKMAKLIKCTSNTHSLQVWWSQSHTQQKKSRSDSTPIQPSTGIWGYSELRLTGETWQLNIGQNY